MTASVITKLEAHNDEMTYGRIPYLLEVKGSVPAGVVVAKLPKISDKSETLVEITVPMVAGKTALALSTMDAIARRILPNAAVRVTYGSSGARRRVYAAS